ncbi:lytic transglycosylase domain-containing protein [Persicimonas caeni]|uniref:Lytic transglycosylase domain-containing protein n=1 Tax=Persicimonas caeni TaxID=2292766 RepID=A0A4Y6Q199_PERCE|nr:lytic transglycosylase domain-containing protein [Persicimonas caeni]QDG54354.1 lytic transglycosylase domain-containing protein [Persicimonas caeni]QED35575.1 lytic transglycosylase domain-containing protein [Persicimonas caeni]
MTTARPKLQGFLLAAVLMCASVLVPSPASAELYRYETPDGKILITTEKKSGYKLLEVLSGGSKTSTKDKKIRKRSASKSSSTKTKRKRRKHSKRKGEDAFDDIIAEASEAYDVPFGFIKAVIRVESAFKPNAESHAGAQGLMQLMPRTAASLNVTDSFDPRQNIYGGAKFLRILIDRYDGDINLILAAYNAGDAAVKRYDGIPYPQTRDYVASVFYWYKIYQKEEESK